MELIYRSAGYQSKTYAIPTIETTTTAKFLGNTYTVRHSQCVTKPLMNQLKYRGVSYQRGAKQAIDSKQPYASNSQFIPFAS